MEKRQIKNCSAIAALSNVGDMTYFSFGNRQLRFAAPRNLRRYLKVKAWDGGLITVDADYGGRVMEEYVDLVPVLRDLLIPKRFLSSIKSAEVRYE